MYEYLAGKLVEKRPTEIILDVQGVGYLVQIPLSTHSVLPPLGDMVRILTYFIVREDAHQLYGFASSEEREFFKLLLGIAGIGPKLALTVLSGLSLDELKQAIVDGEIATLTRISGIGRKTAERMIVELREKVLLQGQPPFRTQAVLRPEKTDPRFELSVEALVKLGYKRQNAKAAVEKVLKEQKRDGVPVEVLIRESLKYV